jgi:TP901 family phage tail tape measure protein
MSNVVEILVTAKNLTGPTMAAVNAEVNKTSKGMALLNKTSMLAVAGFAAVAVESVKMAAKFDSEMTLLQTQAGVSADKIDGLKKGVLGLAGKVGQDPDSLAESLFHVESNFESMGITSEKALKLTETAAKGATVGHAGLVDVTNALTAAVAANIPGVENLDQAMGVLNATVGVGDMKMSDLAAAFGTGMVATVKGYGLSIADVAAGLAVFGDNNIRGAKAGTQLRMTVQSLATGAAGGAGALKSIGLATDTLAKDMQKGGLKLALEDLVAHMKAAGLSSKQQGQFITEAFGKKAGTGLNILVDQMDRLESKYPALAEGAKGFGKAWADTQKTFAFQMKQLQASFDALMIGMGEKIIPPLQSFIHLLAAHKTATIDATVATAGLLAGMVALAAAMKVAAGVKLTWAALTAGAALAKSAFESAALKMMYMRDASLAAGGGLKGLGAAFGTLSTGAKLGVAVVAIGAIVLALEKISTSGKKAPDVDRMATALGNLATSGKAGGELTKAFGDSLSGLADDVDKLGGKKDALDHFNDAMNKVFTLGLGHSNGPKQATKDLDSVDKGLAQLVSNGHADQAAAALTKFAAAGVAMPIDKLDDYEAALGATKLQSDLTAAAQGRFGDQAQKVQQQLSRAEGRRRWVGAVVAGPGPDQPGQLQLADEVLRRDRQGQCRAEGQREDALPEQREGPQQPRRLERDRLGNGRLHAEAHRAGRVDVGHRRGVLQGLRRAGESRGGLRAGRGEGQGLADSLLHVPDEVKIGANISDLEAKLAKAKRDLKTAPPSKEAKLKADISQLEAQIRKAKAELASIEPKTVGVNIVVTRSNVGNVAHEGGGYATGGLAPIGQTAWVGEDGPELMQVTPRGTRIVSNADSKKLAKLNGLRVPGYAHGTLTKAQQAAIDRANAERDARNSMSGAFGINMFGRMAGWKTSSFQNAFGKPASTGDLIGTLTQWQGMIKAATHGAEEKKLVKAFDKYGAAAIKNELALTKVNTALASARDKLASLKDAAAQLKDSVSGGIVSGGSITKSGGANALGVLENMQGSVNDAKRFAAELAKLKKAGLNSQSLSELAQAGVDGGLGLADALSGASPEYLKKLNALEKQLQAAGGSAGGTAADSMYGAGIAQAQGLVAGLQKQQASLDKIMMNAANAMAAELKKALGRKGAGGTVGAAAAGGNRWGRTLVGEYGPEIADLPVGSRVHSAPDTARMLAGAQAAPQVIDLVVNIGGVQVGAALIDPLRGEIRNRGGNVQVVLGQRGA